ncbi:helix-turn-helix domain-containing protein [Mucilaginibacter sp. UYCu711]|uniref:helix-turn-helix domain-containing protein n=1 Tax=Mucilaginibacter sp. UYCu711 TaxID=3156339 RepID=UPI003D22A8D2
MISDLDKEVLILFGNHLKSLRLTKKLTYRKMALNCNIDYGDIQKIESGKVNITILTLRELAKALEIEPKLLLDFKGMGNIVR